MLLLRRNVTKQRGLPVAVGRFFYFCFISFFCLKFFSTLCVNVFVGGGGRGGFMCVRSGGWGRRNVMTFALKQ